MTSGNFIKNFQKIIAEEELVDFLMWCVEFDVELSAIQGDVISLYRKHKHSIEFAA